MNRKECWKSVKTNFWSFPVEENKPGKRPAENIGGTNYC
jgi:hypothetical protein